MLQHMKKEKHKKKRKFRNNRRRHCHWHHQTMLHQAPTSYIELIKSPKWLMWQDSQCNEKLRWAEIELKKKLGIRQTNDVSKTIHVSVWKLWNLFFYSFSYKNKSRLNVADFMSWAISFLHKPTLSLFSLLRLPSPTKWVSNFRVISFIFFSLSSGWISLF